ncbi:MAG TPA: serine hydrolase domain-containing protein [Longimicrobium sp.]
MPTRIAAAVAYVTMALAAVSPAAAQDGVDALFAPWASRASPGCAVAAARDGRTLFARAYGQAELERDVPITPETVFEAGSVSKQFTAAAILLLVANGKISLADDVRRYVPELPDYGTRITIDHLLGHRGGLREWEHVAAIAGWTPVSFGDFLGITARQRSLNFRPGEQFQYGGAGYVLAALVVERTSGQSLAEFSRARIFEPLGMNATRWRIAADTAIQGRAIAYQKQGGGYVQSMPASHVYGHGGLHTTVGDLLRWNEALAHARLGRFVSAELYREGRLRDGRATGYGRGVFVGTYRDSPEVFHDGGYGGYRAWLGRYPDAGLSVALLCNTPVGNVTALGRRVVDGLLPERESGKTGGTTPRPAAPAAASLPAGEAERYAGVFLSDELGLPLFLAADSGRLDAEGSIAQRVAPGRFRVPWAEIIFDTPDVVRLIKSGSDHQTLRRVAGPLPSGEELAALAGRYTSDEANATYLAAIEGGKLVLRLERRPAHLYTLTPIGRDVFRSGGTIVRFHRDARGAVRWLAFSLQRIRELRFARISP